MQVLARLSRSAQDGAPVSFSADGSRFAVQVRPHGAESVVRVYQHDSDNVSSWSQLGGGIPSSESRGGDPYALYFSADGSAIAIVEKGGDHIVRVKVFKFESSAWAQLGSDISYCNTHVPLISLSCDGSRVAVGPCGQDKNFIRVYEFDIHEWKRVGGDVHVKSISYDNFDVTVSCDGLSMLINNGYVRIYKYASNTNWRYVEELSHEGGSDDLGNNCHVLLTVSGKNSVSGCRKCMKNVECTLILRVYRYENIHWKQIGSNIILDSIRWEYISVSLSNCGRYAAVSSFWNSSSHITVYELVSSHWVQVGPSVSNKSERAYRFWFASVSHGEIRLVTARAVNGAVSLVSYRYSAASTYWSKESFVDNVSRRLSVKALTIKPLPNKENIIASTPSAWPTCSPSSYPSTVPTCQPTFHPTAYPTFVPTSYPTAYPTSVPTSGPTVKPTEVPTGYPTAWPTCSPSSYPSTVPTCQPTGFHPTSLPYVRPHELPHGISHFGSDEQPFGETHRDTHGCSNRLPFRLADLFAELLSLHGSDVSADVSPHGLPYFRPHELPHGVSHVGSDKRPHGETHRGSNRLPYRLADLFAELLSLHGSDVSADVSPYGLPYFRPHELPHGISHFGSDEQPFGETHRDRDTHGCSNRLPFRLADLFAELLSLHGSDVSADVSPHGLPYFRPHELPHGVSHVGSDERPHGETHRGSNRLPYRLADLFAELLSLDRPDVSANFSPYGLPYVRPHELPHGISHFGSDEQPFGETHRDTHGCSNRLPFRLADLFAELLSLHGSDVSADVSPHGLPYFRPHELPRRRIPLRYPTSGPR